MKVKTTYYMEEYYPVTIIEDTEEGGFTIYLPDCPGCMTCCERWEDIPETIADAGGSHGKRDTAGPGR